MYKLAYDFPSIESFNSSKLLPNSLNIWHVILSSTNFKHSPIIKKCLEHKSFKELKNALKKYPHHHNNIFSQFWTIRWCYVLSDEIKQDK